MTATPTDTAPRVGLVARTGLGSVGQARCEVVATHGDRVLCAVRTRWGERTYPIVVTVAGWQQIAACADWCGVAGEGEA